MDDLLSGTDDEPIDVALRNLITVTQPSSSIRNPEKVETFINDKDYQVLSTDDIVQHVIDFVQDVNAIVQLPSTVTRMLLSHCKWDKTVLMEKFYDDSDKLFKEAHVINPFNILNDSVVQPDTIECEICLLEPLYISSKALACGHRFCTSCWSKYLTVNIMDEGVGNSISCPATDCDIIIDDETVIELVNNTPAKRTYQHLITNSFVQQNQLLRWCPAPGCSFAVKVEFSPTKPMACKCHCGHEFCFDCGDNWHGPTSCEVLSRFHFHLKEGVFDSYLRRNVEGNLVEDDYDDDNHIKKCPNPYCKTFIQKISGCNAMICKICSVNFCWLCMASFRNDMAVHAHICSGEPKTPVKLVLPAPSSAQSTQDNNVQGNVSSRQRKVANDYGESSKRHEQKTSTNVDRMRNEHDYINGEVEQHTSRQRKVANDYGESIKQREQKTSMTVNHIRDNHNNVQGNVEYLLGQSEVVDDYEQPSKKSKQKTSSEAALRTDRVAEKLELTKEQIKIRDIEMTRFRRLQKYQSFGAPPLYKSLHFNVKDSNEASENQQHPNKTSENQPHSTKTSERQSYPNKAQKCQSIGAPRNKTHKVTVIKYNRQSENQSNVPQKKRQRQENEEKQADDVHSHKIVNYYYYNRYHAHDSDLKINIWYFDRIKLMDVKLPNLSQLKLASTVLTQSLQTLKYAAIFGLYLGNVDQSFIFEGLYKELEVATNALSKSVAHIMMYDDISHVRIPLKIIPAYEYCKHRRQALLDCIDDGYDNEWWTFQNEPNTSSLNN